MYGTVVEGMYSWVEGRREVIYSRFFPNNGLGRCSTIGTAYWKKILGRNLQRVASNTMPIILGIEMPAPAKSEFRFCLIWIEYCTEY